MILSLSPSRRCEEEHVVMATSTNNNFSYRQRLRARLGQKYFLLFLLGTSQDRPLSDLAAESQQFGDILQVDNLDQYQALPYKILLGYTWVNRYCGPTTKARRHIGQNALF